MKINRTNYSQAISKLEKNKPASSSSKVDKPKDSISISSESLRISEYLKNARSEDAAKVETIKNQLREGTYKVDSGKLAEKILQRMKDQGSDE